MDVPKTFSSLTLCLTIEHRAMSTALAAVTTHRCALPARCALSGHALGVLWLAWAAKGHQLGPCS
jgi:hypothetical protein